jgi:hypothetical protein
MAGTLGPAGVKSPATRSHAQPARPAARRPSIPASTPALGQSLRAFSAEVDAGSAQKMRQTQQI